MKKILFLLCGFLVIQSAMSQVREVRAFVTRPVNNTTYTAGDVVCSSDSLPLAFTIPAGFRAGKIYTARIAADTVNVSNGTFTLFLYADSVGLGKLADNAAHVNTHARDSNFVGSFAFTLVATGSASATEAYAYNLSSPPMPIQVKGGALYGRLTATGAYVPKISGLFRIVLTIGN